MGVKIVHGDALTCLRELPAASAQCCVTSPPYWGLRDYDRLMRDGLGIELNPDYEAMADDRIRSDAPLLYEVTT